MRKYFLILCMFMISFFNLYAQKNEITKIEIVNIEIEVPTGYFAKNKYAISNDIFSAEWLYLTNEMVANGIEKEIMNQFESQIKYSDVSTINFYSFKGNFLGKKYLLKGKQQYKYRILAFGKINDRPLIFNLGFKDDPNSSNNFDDLTKNFISFEK